MKDEYFVTLAKAYIAAYEREIKIYDTLNKLGITFEIFSDPLNSAIEKIFNDEFGGDFCSCLLEFSDDKKVTFFVDGKDIECTDIESVIKYYKVV